MSRDIFGWEQCKEVVVIEVLVDKWGLDGGGTPVDIGVELDIRTCRFWSWIIKLTKILFVETSKTCWYSATSCRYY